MPPGYAHSVLIQLKDLAENPTLCFEVQGTVHRHRTFLIHLQRGQMRGTWVSQASLSQSPATYPRAFKARCHLPDPCTRLSPSPLLSDPGTHQSSLRTPNSREKTPASWPHSTSTASLVLPCPHVVLTAAPQLSPPSLKMVF